MQLPQEQFFCGFKSHRAYQNFVVVRKFKRSVGRTERHLPAKQRSSQEASGFDSRTLRHRRKVLPSAKFAQVREPGRNGPAVTRSSQEGDAEVQILPCAPGASVRELE
jgi:hypothetical protein